jgi:hypothetical protein
LTQIKGIGPKSAEKIIASVKDYYMQFSEQAEAETAQAAGAEENTAETSLSSVEESKPSAGSSTSGEKTQDSDPQMQTESQNDIKD